METLDIAILLMVIWAVIHGWKQGLIKEAISMVGFFVGIFIAFQLYTSFGSYLAPNLASHPTVASYIGKSIAFILIWAVCPILLGVVGNILTKSLKGIHLGFFNSTAGAVVSLIKYLILMSFICSAMDYVGILSDQKKQDSRLYQPLASFVQHLFEDEPDPQSVSKTETEKNDTVWINVQHKK